MKRADQIDVHDDTKTIRGQLIDRGEEFAAGDKNINVSELLAGGFERPADRLLASLGCGLTMCSSLG